MVKDVLDTAACACANLRKATRIVTQTYDAALKQTGLKATQFTLLATIDKTGEQPLSRLANAMVMDRTTLTRNLNPLISKGYIDIIQGSDHRVRRICLTPSGAKILKKARPAWEKAQSTIVGNLGQEQWGILLTSLNNIVNGSQPL